MSADLSVLLEQLKAPTGYASKPQLAALADVAEAAEKWVSAQGTNYDYDNLLDALARLRLVLAGEEEA